jgi:hypothetical protein
MSSSRIVPEPRVGASMPMSIRTSVVFPDPLRPSSAQTAPRGTESDTWSTAQVEAKYRVNRSV